MASMRRTIIRSMKRNHDTGKDLYFGEKLNRRERRARAKQQKKAD